ncbi:hypothetical protein RF11_11319 [Thelohanellus kitauei]|uniref:Uncharacterized protein n=1 Tax=Thelohanellus kitauei TaxID=669202 RepID=A0A0C2MA83_THEKT|nr:hypothetical protein RF11_11319 [Thelohanellus kitauei]
MLGYLIILLLTSLTLSAIDIVIIKTLPLYLILLAKFFDGEISKFQFISELTDSDNIAQSSIMPTCFNNDILNQNLLAESREMSLSKFKILSIIAFLKSTAFSVTFWTSSYASFDSW